MDDIVNTLAVLALPAAGLAGLAGLFVAFRAFGMAGQATGEEQGLYYLLALHLGEPAATVLWMAFGFRSLSLLLSDLSSSPAFLALVLTAPMAILLIPAVALRWPPSSYRSSALGTLILGVLRWAGSFALICSLDAIDVARDNLGVAGIIAAVGTALLWFCVIRVHWILRKQQRLTADTITR
jgi:hypothetical protein